MKVLIVAAHPDDEALGCGGATGRHVLEGDEVYCLILGEGIASRYDKKDVPEKELKQLKSQAKRAAKILGIKKLVFKDFPDSRFDIIPLLDIVKAIEQVKKEFEPDIVYTHHQGDLNIDHRLTFSAVLTACRPLKNETVRTIYSFEVPSSTEWSSPDAPNYFIPNVFIDISKTIDRKVKALKAYRSEVREFPHPRSPQAVLAIATRWGSLAGCRAAEAFRLVRTIK